MTNVSTSINIMSTIAIEKRPRRIIVNDDIIEEGFFARNPQSLYLCFDLEKVIRHNTLTELLKMNNNSHHNAVVNEGQGKGFD